jgi:hypothetical protein
MPIDESTSLAAPLSTIYIFSFSTEENISFKAFLTDFSDNFTSNWNSQEIYGKMDPIYTYKNTIRKITLAFDVPSFDQQEAIDNSKKADSIIRSLYPIYDIKKSGETAQKGTALISGPPFFKIKFANLIMKADGNVSSVDASTDGLLGWIDGFNFKPELESGFFVSVNDEEAQILVPKLYKVNFNFNVLHEHPLGTEVAETKISRLGTKNFSHIFDTTVLSTPQQARTQTTPLNANQEAAEGDGNVDDE